MSDVLIDRVWLVECDRCANEGMSDEFRKDDALTDFRRFGWTREQGRNFCPQCNGAREHRPQ